MKIILLIISGALLLPSCNFSDDIVELSGGWKFVKEGKYDKIIDGGKSFIPCEVKSYCYNEHFILVSQSPTKECFVGKDQNYYKYGNHKIYYWIIIHQKDIVLGPLSEEEFINARKKFKISESLQLEKA